MNSGFQGFIELEDTFKGVLLVMNTSDTPINADALPTFRVYGPNGYLGVSGTTSLLDTGNISGATNASPIVITTSSAHGLTTGARVVIASVGGNTAANGTFVVTYVSSTTFSLDGSTGNGAYTSGGTFTVVGAYRFSIAATGANGFAEGERYDVLFNFAISSTQKGAKASFQVT